MTSQSQPKIYAADWVATNGRVQSLDGLRALSILLVLFGHFVLPPSIRGIGAFGVTVFFFISGFLITRLLFAEFRANGKIDIKSFYLRRLLRLYPVIIVSIAFCAFAALIRGQQIDPTEIGSVFFYFANYLIAYRELHHIPFSLLIGPFWSLSVEEHFYFLFPGIFVIVRGNPLRIAQAAIVTCVLCLSLRLIYLTIWPEWIGTLTTYWRSETRFDSIAFGVLMAALCELPNCRSSLENLFKPKVAFVAGLVLVFSFLFRQAFYQETLRFTLQGLALFPLLGCIIFSKQLPLTKHLLNHPVIVWVGKLSYSLYVWHGTVIYLLSGFARDFLPPVAEEWFLMFFSFLFAIASYYALELPFMNLRRRLRP